MLFLTAKEGTMFHFAQKAAEDKTDKALQKALSTEVNALQKLKATLATQKAKFEQQ